MNPFGLKRELKIKVPSQNHVFMMDGGSDCATDSSSSSLSDGEDMGYQRVILCGTCGSMDSLNGSVKCNGCSGRVEMCINCISGIGGRNFFCRECIINTEIKIEYDGYSICGKAKVIKRVLNGPIGRERFRCMSLKGGDGISLDMVMNYLRGL